MDAAGLAAFLRARRHEVEPEDVGLSRGPRRRTAGLRREEVAALSTMSADYYGRLERGIGHRPSVVVLTAIARGLCRTPEEWEHLFHLAGHHAPPHHGAPLDDPDPSLRSMLDRLTDTPAAIVTGVGETLRQTALSRVLFGDETRFTGLARSAAYRWFTDPRERLLYPPQDHLDQGRIHASQLRTAVGWPAVGRRSAAVAAALLRESTEFAGLWAEQRVGLRHGERRRLVHPVVGELEFSCAIVVDPQRAQALIAYVPTPGGAVAARLARLARTSPAAVADAVSGGHQGRAQ